MAEASLAFIRAWSIRGTAMAAIAKTIITTTIISTREKPPGRAGIRNVILTLGMAQK
jgi:hypothetical protein